jgi:hypothetical protein
LNRFRHIFFALWMALAVVVGQQAVVLHDLSHVAGHKQDSTPGKSTCDKCFACAQLSGAVGASVPVVPAIPADDAAPIAVIALVAPAPARFAYQSRAPPPSLA